MAVAPITPLVADRTGAVNMTTANSVIATAGTPFTFPNSGNQVVRCKATATDAAITVAIPATVDGDAIAGKVTPALTATTDMLFGPFPVSLYGTTVSLSGPVLATTSFWVIQMIAGQ